MSFFYHATADLPANFEQKTTAMKRIFLFSLIIVIMTTQILAQAKQPTLILVHGGWHGAWCWQKVLPLLRNRNIPVQAIDMPGQGADTTPVASISFADYVQRIVAAANQTEGPVVLLGHSSGGTPIAQAAEILGPEKVAALIFLDAFMPRDGESVFSLVDAFQNKSKAPGDQGLATSLQFSADQKITTLKPDKVQQLLYHDCSPEDIAFATAHLGPQPLAPQATPVQLSDKSYGVIPKYYILCTEAKDFDKSGIATHVPCRRIYKLPSSHSPFFSMPDKLVAIIGDVYTQVHQAVAK